ncbi:hypothetical protein H7R52_00020 [Weissella confusa]|uniref:YhgE/Pip domain-containing protein n=1 Tax=Weissella confusa TaxID=1583 RepID=A0A923SMN3_WEICO|nr:hypothetical protein [Weissella confusa]
MDKPGAFLAVVFLVLQLSGSAGTYPIQLTSGFFKWLHPYLPMTYTVDGFREWLAFNLMMGMGEPRKKPESELGWFASKMSVLVFYSVLAATIVYGLAVAVLGLDPIHPWATYGMTVMKIQGGNATLAEKLGEVGKATSGFHATKALYNQVATPVKAVETEKDHVKNNGTGMTPYMLSVGLYVGISNQVTAGLGELNQNSATLLSGSQQLSGGLTTVKSNVPALISGADQIRSGSSQLADGSKTLGDGLVPQKLSALQTDFDNLEAKLQPVLDKAQEKLDSAAQLHDKVQTIAENDLANGIEQIREASAAITELTDGPKPEHLEDAKQVVAQIKAQKEILADAQKNDQQELAKLINGLNELDDNQKQVVLQAIEKQQSNSAMNATTLTSGVATYTSGVNQAYDGSKEVSDGLSQLNDKLGTTAVNQDLADVEATLADVQTKADELLAGTVKAVKKVGAGVNDAAKANKALSDGSLELEDGNKTITTNLGTLTDGATDFENGTKTLDEGVTQLSDDYMKITIPKDFSKNATSLLADKPKKMVLHYEISSGHSFIAGKMAETAAEGIVAQVAGEVTETYAKQLSSLWNPYQKVSDLPVVVVNKDKAYTVDKQKLSVGKDLASELKKSDAMDFTVLNEKEANKGISDGKYRQ